jgi:hypothetical protein
MSRYRWTKSTRMIAGPLVGLLFAISAIPLGAQPVPETRRPYYDMAKEVTVVGTVSKVFTKSSPGMIAGSHIVLATAAGAVDASLGRFGLQGKGALSVAAGQQVEVTGVMKTLKNRQVFVARTVRAGSHVYAMRNQHGIPMSPQARERASRKAAQKGVSL